MAGSKECMGLASGLSLMINSSPRFPRPLNTIGNCFRMSLSISSCAVVSIRAASFSAVMAGRPNRLVLSPVTTYTY